MIQPRLGVDTWYQLIRYLPPGEPFAMTHTEWTWLCRNQSFNPPPQRLMGRPIVVIDDWPAWLEPAA